MTYKQRIEEILYDFAWLHVNEANALMEFNGWSIEQRNKYVNKHKADVTTQLLALMDEFGDEVVGDDIGIHSWDILGTTRNQLRAEARTRKKELLK